MEFVFLVLLFSCYNCQDISDGVTERILFNEQEGITKTRYVPRLEPVTFTSNEERKENIDVIDRDSVENMISTPEDGVTHLRQENSTLQPEPTVLPHPEDLEDMDKSTECVSPDNSTTTPVTPEQRNVTYVTVNGRQYKITRIRRHRPKMPSCLEERNIQRRTIGNFVNTLTSKFPLKWTTKLNETKLNKIRQFWRNGWTGWPIVQVPKVPISKSESNPINNNVGVQDLTKNKVNKLLSLFTIIKFDNGGCQSQDGIRGTCYHKTECDARLGRAIGYCAKGFGVCCYIERSCGQRTRENCTYFANPGFPHGMTTAPSVCSLMVEKINSDVKQFRLEFQMFELRGPVNGTCQSDRLVVSGQNKNSIVPEICGVNTNQHMYVDVDETNGPLNLNMILMGENVPRSFRIKITQLKENDELRAPKNCLQYHTGVTGVIETFNYQFRTNGNGPQALPGYFNNMNYAVCIKKGSDFCSVTYSTIPDDDSFQLVNVDEEGERLVPPGQGGAEIFNCPDDFIVVNGIRLCGDRLNDASVDIDYRKNAPVTDFSYGPTVLPIRSNQAVTGRGIYMEYRQNPCLF